MNVPVPFRIEPSRITSRPQVAAGPLAFAEVIPSTFPLPAAEREAELQRMVRQANAFPRLLETIDGLVAAIEEANGFPAIGGRAPVNPREVAARAKGLAAELRRPPAVRVPRARRQSA